MLEELKDGCWVGSYGLRCWVRKRTLDYGKQLVSLTSENMRINEIIYCNKVKEAAQVNN